TQREMMRDDLGDEATRSGHDDSHTDLENALEEHPQNDDAPSHKNCRGVEMCHRWPAFQEHAEQQPRGVQRKSENQNIETGSANWLGQINPKETTQHQRRHIDHHRLVERLKLVKEKLA